MVAAMNRAAAAAVLLSCCASLATASPPGGSPGSFDFWFVSPSPIDGPNLALAHAEVGYSIPLHHVGPWDFSVRPQFEVMTFGGPAATILDLPPQAFMLGAEFRADLQMNKKTRASLAISPGLFTDFNNVSGDAFRIPARLIVTHFYSPEWLFLGGVVYTAQPDFPIVPVVGAIWNPSPDWRVELTFPRPRVVYRYSDELEIYGIASVTTATYAVRSFGVDEVLQYRDFRAGFGVEYGTTAGFKVIGEIGAAFIRELQFDSDRPERDVDPGLYIRFGSKF